MKITDVTRTLLTDAGWDSSRHIDTAAFEAALLAERYLVTAAVREFLASFGGLEVSHPHAKVKNVVDRFHLNPIEAIRRTFRENVQIYEERVGETLTLIGEASRGHMVLMMGASGRVYAAADEFLELIGENGPDALVALCEGKPSLRVFD